MRPLPAFVLLTAGVLAAACFDFGKYSFSETRKDPLLEGSAGLGGSDGLGGSGLGGSRLGSAGAGSAGSSSGGSSPAGTGSCPEGVGMPGCPPPTFDPVLGTTCQSSSDCGSYTCVDGVCCDAPCDELCAACNQPGQQGHCSLLRSDGACPAITSCPASTECVTYQAPTAEQGSCEAQGKCRECQVVPALTSAVCGNGGHCNGAGACVSDVPGLKALGSVCASADECLEGFCATTASGSRVCCNQACDGNCQQCSPEGRCDVQPEQDARCAVPQCPADDVCSEYPDSPVQGSCAGFERCAVQADVCQRRALRPATECACDQAGGCKLAPGVSCQSGAECSTGLCTNGVCCNGACDGCQQCGAGGRCVAIPNCECEPGARGTCGGAFGSQGVCAARAITCGADRRWPRGACNGSTELCEDNDRDEDCNGDPNNGCECLNGNLLPCSTVFGSRGECRTRTVECTNGRWPAAACNPASGEICNNGRDDDCDGSTDENCLDPNACNFLRASCQSRQCSRCEGCEPCARMVACIQDTLDNGNPCPTSADPACERGACRATLDQVLIDFEGSGSFVPDALAIVRDFVTCACTR